MNKILTASAAAAALFSAGSASAATILSFDNQLAFQTATNTVVEDFADTTLVSGLTLSSTPNNAANVFVIQNGVLRDSLVKNDTLNFNFSAGQTAFGGIFNLVTNSTGTAGLQFSVRLADGTTQVLQPTVPTNCNGCFFGFTSDTAFNQVTIKAAAQTGSETLQLDNLEFGSTVAAVPEPATWAMFLMGFGAVGYSMRSRKATYRPAQAV